MKRLIRIGIIGCGTVGKGVIEILKAKEKLISERIGAKIYIEGVCDLVPIKFKVPFYTKRYQELIQRPDIDIIVELIGGYEPAHTIIVESLKAGKHIVTANKAVLAKYWDEIFSLSRDLNRLVYFEAAVGGSIPVIQSINEGLAANDIKIINGILNGTTNFILTEMTQQGLSFFSALKKAQKYGFAESNPQFDIKGIDTAHKLAILSSLAWSCWVKIEDILTIGIEDVSEDDINFAQEEFGYIMKLIGTVKKVDNSLELSVQPCLIPRNHPFVNINGENNAVRILGDAAGDIILSGKGAGKMPAASAVVSDIIFLARQVAFGIAGKIPYVSYHADKRFKILDHNEHEGCYYLRFTTLDKPGVLSKISGILGKNNVSIACVYQKQPLARISKGVPILMLTHKTSYGRLIKAIRAIDHLPIIKSKTVAFKVENN